MTLWYITHDMQTCTVLCRAMLCSMPTRLWAAQGWLQGQFELQLCCGSYAVAAMDSSNSSSSSNCNSMMYFMEEDAACVALLLTLQLASRSSCIAQMHATEQLAAFNIVKQPQCSA